MTYLATTQDPFQPFDVKKPKPGVPESSAYGAILFVAIAVVLLWRRGRR